LCGPGAVLVVGATLTGGAMKEVTQEQAERAVESIMARRPWLDRAEAVATIAALASLGDTPELWRVVELLGGSKPDR
jgi:hypothetical protein